jgi:hypothetical protein
MDGRGGGLCCTEDGNRRESANDGQSTVSVERATLFKLVAGVDELDAE